MNADAKIDVYSQLGDDQQYFARYRTMKFKTDGSGAIISGEDGNPVLMEDGNFTDILITHNTIGETGGGAFVTNKGYKNASVTIFPDMAKRRQFKSATLPTKPSLSGVIVHELLDHGIDFVRNGNTNTTTTPSVSNVKHQNDALIIINSPIRTAHDKH